MFVRLGRGAFVLKENPAHRLCFPPRYSHQPRSRRTSTRVVIAHDRHPPQDEVCPPVAPRASMKRDQCVIHLSTLFPYHFVTSLCTHSTHPIFPFTKCSCPSDARPRGTLEAFTPSSSCICYTQRHRVHRKRHSLFNPYI